MLKLLGGLRPTPSGAYMLCGTCNNTYFTAKLINSPSFEGINGSQITALEICEGTTWNGDARLFAYDKGINLISDKIANSTILNLIASIEAKYGLTRTEGDTCQEFARITSELKNVS